jgi:hypothetical protein
VEEELEEKEVKDKKVDKAVEEEKEQVFWDLTLCLLVLKLWSARFLFGFL